MKGNVVFRLILALALIIPVVATIALPAPVLAASYTLEPSGAGDFTNLSVSGGGSNWFAASASGGSYVYGNPAAWRLDSYELPDVALTGTINSVTVWITARAGATPITQNSGWPALRTHSFTYPIGAETQVPLTTAWADYSSTFTTNPFTGQPWTWDEINELQAGVRLRRASASGVQSQADHVWVVIDYEPAASGPASGPAPVLIISRMMALVDEVLSEFVTVTPGTISGCEIDPMQANITCKGNNLISSLSNTISAGVALIPKLLGALGVVD